MIVIEDYAKTDRLLTLCDEINMPGEVTEQILRHVKNADFTPAGAYFKDLFSMETAPASQKAIHEYFGGRNNGIDELAIYLMAALHTGENYRRAGIDNAIYVNTMRMFTRFANEHLASYGAYGFDRGAWTYRILASVIFRLNQLEFEMFTLRDDVEGYGSRGDPVISVHIPSDAILSRRELDSTYTMAKRFLSEYFGDFAYKYIYCASWLLSPVLQDLLKPDSRILEFQSDYKIINYIADNDSYMVWVYKRKYEDLKSLPETTTLAKNIKNHLLGGGKIGIGYGILNL